ncbi:unnamed protein product [Strongylus vulgaris]|uniref:Galactosyltransferase N-terminal domain-containing protein n=1 Tax=Strongylus vulgaris TaxID=40348 RepID=A0A3P7LNY0_STRVU|nr:unnamed protein product [Strongylus vulgaris]
MSSRNISSTVCTPNATNNTAINVSMEELSFKVLEKKYNYLEPGGHYIPKSCSAAHRKKYNYLEPGGHYIPKNCSAAHRVAVIIPYRDRQSHLKILLNNMHPFLTEQELDYSIIVVEQSANSTFNRGKLLNVGFLEAMKFYNWQCVLLHDVDLLPEDRRNLHVCPTQNPRHMAVAVDKNNYKLNYETMFGTSSFLNIQQFRDVNGLSNRYWGWGGEDDDLYKR